MGYVGFLFGHSVIQYIAGTFLVLAAYSFCVLKYEGRFDYTKERILFKGFENNTFIPRNSIDWVFLLLFVIYLIIFAWNIFYKVDTRHLDSIGMIDGAACKVNNWIGIWVVSGRFMPFAHQEFNILGPVLRLFNCSYAFLYSLVFLQFLTAIYFINKILPFEKLWQRFLTIFLITIDVSFFRIFSNIIINDRNSIFFTILFLYNVIQFYKVGRNANLIYALVCANISLYFKEPMFLFYSGFALTSLVFKIVEDKISLKNIIKKPLNFVKKHPLEVGLLLLSMFFVMGYIGFVLLKGQKEFYGFAGGNTGYFKNILDTFLHYPLFVMIPAMIFLYIKDFKSIKYRSFSIAFFVGGLLYTLSITLMKSGMYYYYCMANLSIMIAVCYYMYDKKRSKIFLMFLIVVIFYSLKLTSVKVADFFVAGKTKQIWLHALRENFKLEREGKRYNIFYYGRYERHGDYRGSTAMLLLKAITREKSPFNLYTLSGCYPWHRGGDGDSFRCFKTESFVLNKYDVVIFDRESISGEEWKDLVRKFGNKMKKITEYPGFLGVKEESNVYIIWNGN